MKIIVNGLTHSVSASLGTPLLHVLYDAQQADVVIWKAGVGR